VRGLDFVGTLVLTTALRTANELGLTRASGLGYLLHLPTRERSHCEPRIPDTVEGAIPRISATLGEGNSRRSAAIVSTRRSSGRSG
jgi:hypothetical protein